MIREYWVIRHKPSGEYLPGLPSGLRAGYTHTEPELLSVPRLFGDRGAARRALTWWLKGVTSVDRYQDTNPDSWGEWNEDWKEEPMPERKLEDMEVVPCLLKL